MKLKKNESEMRKSDFEILSTKIVSSTIKELRSKKLTEKEMREELLRRRPNWTRAMALKIWFDTVELGISEWKRYPAIVLLILLLTPPVYAQGEYSDFSNCPVYPLRTAPESTSLPSGEPITKWSRWKKRHPKICKFGRGLRSTCHAVNPVIQTGGHLAQIYYSLK